MGAFGNLFRARFGNGLHDYSPPTKPKIPTKKELLETDEEHFEMITKSCEEKIQRLQRMIDQIKDDRFVLMMKTDKYINKLAKWRENFLKTL